MADTTDNARPGRSGRFVFIVVLMVAALAAAGAAALLVSIVRHKEEAKNPFFRVVELTDETVDPAVWGQSSQSLTPGAQRSNGSGCTTTGSSPDEGPQSPGLHRHGTSGRRSR